MNKHFQAVVSNILSNKKKKKTGLGYMSARVDTDPDECTKPNYAFVFFLPSGLYNFCREMVGVGIAAYHFSFCEKTRPHASIRLRKGDSGPAIVDRLPISLDRWH